MKFHANLLVIFLSVFTFLNSDAQKLDFWIIHSDDTVGVLNVERKQVSNRLNYKLYTKIDVTFIVHLVIINNMAIVYENGKLLAADVDQTSNRGVFDADIHAKFNKNQYEVVKNGNSYIINEKEIAWSVSRMYFDEPLGIKAVYAEDNGKMVNLEPRKKGQYGLKVSFPSVFSYENGILVNMVAETFVGDIHFIKK